MTHREWQPIADAPRDQRKLLLYGAIATSNYGEHRHPTVCLGYYNNDSGKYPGFDWTVEPSDVPGYIWCKPTHFAEIPPAPVEA